VAISANFSSTAETLARIELAEKAAGWASGFAMKEETWWLGWEEVDLRTCRGGNKKKIIVSRRPAPGNRYGSEID
jgi:hypothetical protein